MKKGLIFSDLLFQPKNGQAGKRQSRESKPTKSFKTFKEVLCHETRTMKTRIVCFGSQKVSNRKYSNCRLIVQHGIRKFHLVFDSTISCN